ncbi:hypothetical protein HD554DRAFT_2167031 [Boletus coccyginus]|nr:hypothetical protein HD554DRAFT_2167031 [Boletus coccyginus]
MEDLGVATVLNREALDLCPQGHPYQSTSLNNLAVRLSTRYNQLGGTGDLDGAIVLDREALDVQRHRILHAVALISDKYRTGRSTSLSTIQPARVIKDHAQDIRTGNRYSISTKTSVACTPLPVRLRPCLACEPMRHSLQEFWGDRERNSGFVALLRRKSSLPTVWRMNKPRLSGNSST